MHPECFIPTAFFPFLEITKEMDASFKEHHGGSRRKMYHRNIFFNKVTRILYLVR
jgi:hypothetical protein